MASRENAAEKTWQRIKKALDGINGTQNRAYAIRVSQGIAAFYFQTSESIDTVLNAAEQRMYQEKIAIKKDLDVLRRPAER